MNANNHEWFLSYRITWQHDHEIRIDRRSCTGFYQHVHSWSAASTGKYLRMKKRFKPDTTDAVLSDRIEVRCVIMPAYVPYHDSHQRLFVNIRVHSWL
jgi:hypothetical protein